MGHKASTANLILVSDNITKNAIDHSLQSAAIKYPKVSRDKSAMKQREESTDEREESLSYFGYDRHDISTIHEHQKNCCQRWTFWIFGKRKYGRKNDRNVTLLLDDRNGTKGDIPSDAQLFYGRFVASLNRTWVTSLYCGSAFFLRAIVLIIPDITEWYEREAYVHAMYFLLLEILPIFSMLYIYGNATNHIGKN